MSQIVAPQGAGRRALMLILGGASSPWVNWLREGTPPNLYARVVRRDEEHSAPLASSPFYMTIGSTRWFPGGFTYPTAGASEAGG